MSVHHIKLRNLALVFKTIVKKADIKYCLVFGALLGSIRTGDLIMYDDDIDIALHETDLKKLRNTIKESDPKISIVRCFDGSLYRFHYKTDHSVFIDLFPLVLNTAGNKYIYKGMMRCSFKDEFDILDPFDIFYRLGKVEIDGVFTALKLTGPKDGLTYVQQTYGTTWKQPKFTVVHTVVGIRNSYLYTIINIFGTCVVGALCISNLCYER